MYYIKEVKLKYTLEDIKECNPLIRLNNYSRSFVQMQMETCITCKSHCKSCMGFGAKEHEKNKIMSKEMMIRCIDLARQVLSINRIYLQISGEFFCNPEAIHLLDYIEESYMGLDLYIDTSGIPINDKIIERLSTMKLNKVHLSISIWGGTRELYKENNGVDKLDYVESIIHKLIKLHQNPNCSLELQFSTAYVNKKSVDSVRDFIKRLCTVYGMSYYESDENFLGRHDALVNYIRNFNDFVPAIDKDEDLPKDYATMGKYPNTSIMCYNNESVKDDKVVPYKKSEPTRCNYLSECMVINQNGYIVPCFQKLSKPESAYCNVMDDELTKNPMKLLEILSNKNPYVAKINHDNYINGSFIECNNCFTRLTCR